MKEIVYAIMWGVTIVIGYTINKSVIWAILNGIFWPITWVKWLICKDVNMTIIKESFSFFLT